MMMVKTPAGLSSARSTCPICRNVNINAAVSARLLCFLTTVNKQAQVPHNNVIYCLI